MWPFSKKLWPFLNSEEQKKRPSKKFGETGKKVRVDGPQQKKVPSFPIFWPLYHKRLATPALGYVHTACMHCIELGVRAEDGMLCRLSHSYLSEQHI